MNILSGKSLGDRLLRALLAGGGMFLLLLLHAASGRRMDTLAPGLQTAAERVAAHFEAVAWVSLAVACAAFVLPLARRRHE